MDPTFSLIPASKFIYLLLERVIVVGKKKITRSFSRWVVNVFGGSPAGQGILRGAHLIYNNIGTDKHCSNFIKYHVRVSVTGPPRSVFTSAKLHQSLK